MGNDSINQETSDSAFDNLAARIERTRKEARRRKSADHRVGYLIGISGCILSGEEVGNGFSALTPDGREIFSIQPVSNIPDIGSLAQALVSECGGMLSILSHLSGRIDHELYISESMAEDPQAALNIAYQVVSLLRLRTGCLMNAASFSDAPWGQIAVHDSDVYLQDIYELWPPLWESTPVVTEDDLQWVASHLIRNATLSSQPSYALAYRSAADAPYIKDSRTAVARIWSGIEALFDVQNELSFRLSMYAAVLVSDNADERISVQAEFKRLYGLRSKAVHGAKMDEVKLQDTVKSSWSLLRDLLLACLRTGTHVPSPAELDRALLGQRLTRNDGAIVAEERSDTGAQQ